MTTRGKDTWQALPDVVAQLQAEAVNPALSRPRIAWPDEPVRTDEARPHERRPQAPGTAARAARPLIPVLRERALERPSTNERAPTNEQIEWGGLSDYDRLAADPRPNLRELGQLLGDACQRSCGTRYRSIARLVDDVSRRIDQLLTEPDAESLQAQRQALCKLLDRIEDLLASLTVNS